MPEITNWTLTFTHSDGKLVAHASISRGPNVLEWDRIDKEARQDLLGLLPLPHRTSLWYCASVEIEL